MKHCKSYTGKINKSEDLASCGLEGHQRLAGHQAPLALGRVVSTAGRGLGTSSKSSAALGLGVLSSRWSSGWSSQAFLPPQSKGAQGAPHQAAPSGLHGGLPTPLFPGTQPAHPTSRERSPGPCVLPLEAGVTGRCWLGHAQSRPCTPTGCGCCRAAGLGTEAGSFSRGRGRLSPLAAS